jgi:hypothetical protein
MELYGRIEEQRGKKEDKKYAVSNRVVSCGGGELVM